MGIILLAILPQFISLAVIWLLFRQRAKDQIILRETIAKAFLLEATRGVSEPLRRPIPISEPGDVESVDYEEQLREWKSEAAVFEQRQEEFLKSRQEELEKRQRSAMSKAGKVNDVEQ
jgi:hypothetical protein